MRIILAAIAVTICSPALAGPQCTDEPESKWMTESEIMEYIRPLGHEVEVLKKTSGNCYEIYGKTHDGKRVEVYFHPITGAIVKSKIL